MSELNLRKSLTGGNIPYEQSAQRRVSNGLSTTEGLQLFRAFTGIQDANLRSSVIHLVELLAAASKQIR